MNILEANQAELEECGNVLIWSETRRQIGEVLKAEHHTEDVGFDGNLFVVQAEAPNGREEWSDPRRGKLSLPPPADMAFFYYVVAE